MNDELRLTTDRVCVTRKLLDTTAELGLERDIVLPDHFPDVFRILRCTAEPRLDSQTISADKLCFELTVTVRVLYLTEGSRRINCIEQDIDLSRALELTESCPDPEVRIELSLRGISCRAKGSRRIDVKGTVCAAVKVLCNSGQTVITGGSGCGIQLRRQTVTYPVKRLFASKRVTVIQQTSLPEDKPAAGAVLRTGCVITSSECRCVAGKLAVKGEAELTVLYACIDKSGEDSVDDLRFTLPFSQIIDMDGVDDSFTVNAAVTPAGCTFTAGKGEEKTAEWELDLNVYCTAEKYGTGAAVTDVFSTAYECEAEGYVSIPAPTGDTVRLTAAAECTLSAPDGTVGQIHDCCGECTKPAIVCEEGRYRLTGNVSCHVLGEGSEGGIFCTEGQCAYEAEVSLPEGGQISEASAEVTGCSYYLGEGGSIRARADIRLMYRVTGGGGTKLVGGIKLDREKPLNKDRSCAIRLCRCGEGEDIWDIAKRCRTSVEAIMEDNELAEDTDTVGGGRLIIIHNA
ncbi:SPOCS domain-containing protein [Ruminococcus sp.]|uniref:DUF3794 and LysM peptidoglycan-binding domain-containing protein n=1 Tax=Ruminococcus sp. TaxID=41978 RepID=UPI0025FEF819|nr:SPOCS domain-containing protein [Ruminococcus sp.]MBQ8966186.1 DUF3794 domain-containing protein [Ruminococcus sp.]